MSLRITEMPLSPAVYPPYSNNGMDWILIVILFMLGTQIDKCKASHESPTTYYLFKPSPNSTLGYPMN